MGIVESIIVEDDVDEWNLGNLISQILKSLSCEILYTSEHQIVTNHHEGDDLVEENCNAH